MQGQPFELYLCKLKFQIAMCLNFTSLLKSKIYLIASEFLIGNTKKPPTH